MYAITVYIYRHTENGSQALGQPQKSSSTNGQAIKEKKNYFWRLKKGPVAIKLEWGGG